MIERAVEELRGLFRGAPSKHAAHESARQVLVDLATEPSTLTEVLRRHLRAPASLGAGHYPVVSTMVESNPDFDLVVNCWLPLPDQDTDLSTKAIHHHGSMLLTTVTAFGPGYEHWLFDPPEPVDGDRLLHRLRLRGHEPHPLGHVAFVDENEAHVPMYPADHTVTLALWSHRNPTTWRDRVKRVPIIRRNAATLRRLGNRLGMAGALDLKNVELFDFYPTADGFVGMRERKEFPLGPNDHYVRSLASVIQATGNESLVDDLARAADRQRVAARAAVDDVLRQLGAGERIAPVFSEGHLGVPYANFRTADIEAALARYGA